MKSRDKKTGNRSGGGVFWLSCMGGVVQWFRGSVSLGLVNAACPLV